jgi:hypothetical protein
MRRAIATYSAGSSRQHPASYASAKSPATPSLAATRGSHAVGFASTHRKRVRGDKGRGCALAPLGFVEG